MFQTSWIPYANHPYSMRDNNQWVFFFEFPGCFSCLSFLWSSSCRKNWRVERHRTNMAQCLMYIGYFTKKSHGQRLKISWLPTKKTFNLVKAFLFGRQEPCIKAICDTKEVTFHGGKAYPVPHIAWPGRTIQCFDIITAGILPFYCRMLGCWHFEVCNLKAAQFAWKILEMHIFSEKCTVAILFKTKHDILLTLSCTSQHKNSGPNRFQWAAASCFSSVRESCEAVFPCDLSALYPWHLETWNFPLNSSNNLGNLDL